MYVQNLLTALALLAAGPALVWLRTGHGHPAKPRRERLAEAGWCAGFLLIALTVAGAFRPRRVTGWETRPLVHWAHGHFAVYTFVPFSLKATFVPAATVSRTLYAPDLAYFTILSVAVAAGIVLVLVPALGRRLVPVTLIGLGIEGLAVARTARLALHPTWSYLVFPSLEQPRLQYLVLPAAYALLLLGGGLLWRGRDHRSPVTRLALGRLGDPARRGAPWGLLLLPVTTMTVLLVIPGRWVGGGVAGAALALAVIAAGAALVVRRYPGFAAGLATVGLLALAAAGLALASCWPTWPGPRTPAPDVLLGAVAVGRQPLADLAAVQALVLLAFAVWLAPRTIPQLRPLLGQAGHAELARRVERLTESRAVAVDTAAADLRRLERDLHDGAQARLVALGMHLRAVEKLIPVSPDAALALVAEARETSTRALTDLRELVRCVHPPVLADRGLGDAVRALALDTPLRIETEVSLPGRLPAPIETACYFAVAEVLTNAAKHSGAKEARICVTHEDDLLRIVVTDFGLGGADAARGSGLAGVERRLATFDGIVAVSSPPGGPTMVVMEVPCASSLPKIFSS